ncbi:carbohydrate kinase family protein [Yoonia sp.]|uniref:carbohydrate kinase family protein n=1 Tax=Yoonia sp. TaxID=2212373 RepID=UPI0019ED348B|nr:carbohydrate kinase family protein [Yoonia sp.]MBE0412773.1 carbohydrate kinase family protein [Yoonia sp.]
MTQPTPLAVVGNVNIDLVMGPVAPWPQPGTEIIVDGTDLRYGGAAGNVALTWRALGHAFQIAANTGRDTFGDWLRDGFAPQSDGWPVSEAATTISVGLTHPDSERTFFTTRGHVAELTWPEVRAMIDWPRLSGGGLLVCGSFITDDLAGDYDALFAHARSHGARIALDTGWPAQGWTAATVRRVRRWLGQCDYLLLNEVETRALSGGHGPEHAPSVLLPFMPEGAIVVVKCGADGVVAGSGTGAVLKVPAPIVTAADTIGAGDIFNAAFLAAQAQRQPLAACLESGVRTASIAISTSPRRYDTEGATPVKGAPA